MENSNKPVVHLISKPDNMLKTVYTACRTCYSADYPINIYNSTDDEEKMLKLIERVISSGHYSTIEHIQVSFAISNVSRACTHQFVRHRHMSFSQKSQRYVKEKGQFDYLIPPTIERNPELKEKFIAFMGEISDKYQEFVEAGRAIGLPTWKIILRHILPNCLSAIIVQTTLKVGSNIISASSLSFLGVGITPPTPEWGAMLSDGRSYIRSSGWMCLFPGLAIMFTVLALNLLGDGLRDAMDPKLKR